MIILSFSLKKIFECWCISNYFSHQVSDKWFITNLEGKIVVDSDFISNYFSHQVSDRYWGIQSN